MRRTRALLAGAAVATLFLTAACTTDTPTDAGEGGETSAEESPASEESGGADSEWFVQADYDRQLA